MTTPAKRPERVQRQDRVLLRLLARVGPHLLAVSRAYDGHRASVAVPHLRAARKAIDTALAQLTRRAA